MSKPAKSRTRTQLNRAQLKAYEARRAEEVQRSRAVQAEVEAAGGQPVAAAAVAPRRRIYALSHEQEMAIIRSDLKRLLMIVAVLLVVLAIATLVLR